VKTYTCVIVSQKLVLHVSEYFNAFGSFYPPVSTLLYVGAYGTLIPCACSLGE